jgi:putative ABC transport system substrate-binding protein
MTFCIRRREFIAALGGSAGAWPIAARAQQDGGVRRVGFLSLAADTEGVSQGTLSLLREGLLKLGWIEGRNLLMEIRFGAGDPERTRAYAAEIVNHAPDVIVTNFGAATRAVQARTRTIPIVFAGAGDPNDGHLVENIARPEGNMTGFTSNSFTSIGGKWVELLKEAFPTVTRVAFPFNPEAVRGPPAYLSTIEAGASARAMQVVRMPVRDTLEIVRALDAFATSPNGGLIVHPSAMAMASREIIALAAQHRLPAIYQTRYHVVAGGLMSYGAYGFDYARGVPTYVDRLLRGAKVSELPVQFSTKFELVVNLKTAKALGFTIPPGLLAIADEVIE